MADDWRLEQLKRTTDLQGQRFQRKAYRQPSAEWDHDHCAGCWATFMVAGKGVGSSEPILHEGFAVWAGYPRGAEYEWICPECFGLFKDEMGWTEID